jgi:N-acetylneuraminic acid mutarotase
MRIALMALMIIALFVTVPAVALADSWQEIPGVLPPARHGHSMVELNGKLYMFGGISGEGRPAPMDDLWQFGSDQWEELTPADPPVARYGHSATAANGKMYITGGLDANGRAIADIWSYDPAANSWTSLPMGGQTPAPSYYHSTVALPDGRVMTFAGLYNPTTPLQTFPHVYNPETGQWVQKNIAPFASLYGHTAFVRDNKMYVVGGSSVSNVTNSDIWVFDPVANAWSQLTPQTLAKPAPRRFHYMTVTADAFRAFGGESETVAEFNDSWEFSFTGQSWTQRADMPMPMSKGQAVALSSSRAVEDVFFGGLSGGVLITKSYAYLPDGAPPIGTGLTTYSAALGKWQFLLCHVGFDKKQAKVNVTLTWAGDTKLKLCAVKVPHHRLQESGLMGAPREDMDDDMYEQWANNHLAQAEDVGEATTDNEIKATLENVRCLILLVRHDRKSATARDVQLSITDFSDNPKHALYFFPLGGFPKMEPPLRHFVSLPVTPVRWRARVPHGIGEQTIETGADFWKWVYTINKPRPFLYGWVRFVLP